VLAPPGASVAAAGRTELEIAVPPWPKFLRGCLRHRESLDAQLPQALVHDAEYG